MSRKDPVRIEVKADLLIAAYVDDLPMLERSKNSRHWYEEIRERIGSQVTVTHFNRVRFLSKFRQVEMGDEMDYKLCFAEMKKFNDLSE